LPLLWGNRLGFPFLYSTFSKKNAASTYLARFGCNKEANGTAGNLIGTAK
jgi:hypothetical protein